VTPSYPPARRLRPTRAAGAPIRQDPGPLIRSVPLRSLRSSVQRFPRSAGQELFTEDRKDHKGIVSAFACGVKLATDREAGANRERERRRRKGLLEAIGEAQGGRARLRPNRYKQTSPIRGPGAPIRYLEILRRKFSNFRILTPVFRIRIRQTPDSRPQIQWFSNSATPELLQLLNSVSGYLVRSYR
jgi:hypothetical protein